MPAAREPVLTQKLTVQEFLAWSAIQVGGRFELFGGDVFKMQAERLRHLIVKGNIYAELRKAIRAAALSCHVLPDGATVVISDDTAYEPDAVVQCSPLGDLNGLVAKFPTIVVEVQSPSSTLSDIYEKLPDYMTVPSILHVLIVDPVKRRTLHYERQSDDGTFRTRLVGATAELRFNNPEFHLQTSTFFDDLDSAALEPTTYPSAQFPHFADHQVAR
jgi:Uma2 family endonuclease